jgi:hypothetical protein
MHDGRSRQPPGSTARAMIQNATPYASHAPVVATAATATARNPMRGTTSSRPVTRRASVIARGATSGIASSTTAPSAMMIRPRAVSSAGAVAMNAVATIRPVNTFTIVTITAELVDTVIGTPRRRASSVIAPSCQNTPGSHRARLDTNHTYAAPVRSRLAPIAASTRRQLSMRSA